MTEDKERNKNKERNKQKRIDKDTNRQTDNNMTRCNKETYEPLGKDKHWKQGQSHSQHASKLFFLHMGMCCTHVFKDLKSFHFYNLI